MTVTYAKLNIQRLNKKEDEKGNIAFEQQGFGTGWLAAGFGKAIVGRVSLVIMLY